MSDLLRDSRFARSTATGHADAVQTAEWTPTSWHERPVAQQPDWPDVGELGLAA